MGVVLAIYAAFAAAAVVQASLVLLQMVEHVRFFFRRLRKPLDTEYLPPVELFVPCKGVEPGFDSMVQRVLAQGYPDYRVTFVVESAADPAYARLKQHLAQAPSFPARLLIAGPARDCGQKVHNLRVATEHVNAAADVLAFMDSDVQPAADWLQRLVCRLNRPWVGAVTGYRWFIPQGKSWPANVVSAWNASVTDLLGPHGMNMIWGGSWAIRRDNFESAGVRQAWQGVLTEDLTTWQAVRRARLPVCYEPACLVASPLHATWGQIIEFGRRQYFLVRQYAPGMWWVLVGGGVPFLAAFWGGLGAGPGKLADGQLRRLGAGAGRSAVCDGGRARGHASSGRHRPLSAAHRGAARHMVVRYLAASALAPGTLDVDCQLRLDAQVTWRGISYRVHDPRRVEILRPDMRAARRPTLKPARRRAGRRKPPVYGAFA